uniref:ShKT domain-containing protein n=1 Tax=Amazona collaria TaxID=241587 RepID=A0A8B9G9P9_9PSIT
MGLLTAIIFLAYKQVDVSAFTHFSFQNQKEILEQHNEIRRSVIPTARNMLKMVSLLSTSLAEDCSLLNNPHSEQRGLTYTSGVTCGENVLLSSYPRTWSEAIQVWNSQASNFKYGYGAVTKNVNIESYTQLIWYNSYQVGCAVAYCPMNPFNYFYVCQYCPPGNNAMQIATPYRSGPKCAECPGHCDRGLCTNPCKYQDFFGNCRNLKMLFTCNHSLVKAKCPATCGCTTQII